MPLPLPLPPTREASTSAVKVKLKQLMLDPLFWSLFSRQICCSAAQIILSIPITDLYVRIGYCWFITQLETPV